jgi:hypothetical protein
MISFAGKDASGAFTVDAVGVSPSLPGHTGEQVEHPTAVAAAIVDHLGAVAAAMDGVAIGPGWAAEAGHALGADAFEDCGKYRGGDSNA